MPRRSRPGLTGGWPSTRRIRGGRRRRGRGADGSSWRTRRPDGLESARTAVAVPSPRLRRSSPRRAWSGPSAPPSSRWTKPRTSRTASSNASHGLRSRHWVALGRRTWPPLMRRLAIRPFVVARRLAGRIVWRNASRSAARTGAARRSLSMRSRMATSPTSWRARVEGHAARRRATRRPSTGANRPRRVARTSSTPTSAAIRARSSSSSGPERCSEPPRWSRQTVQR